MWLCNPCCQVFLSTLCIQKKNEHTNSKRYMYPMFTAAAAAAKSLQSCQTLCDPIDGSPLGSSVPGILQARTLEWVAISFSNAWKWKVKVKSFSRARLLATPWTAAFQAPLSMGFSRQEYWSGVPLTSPELLKISKHRNNPSALQQMTGLRRCDLDTMEYYSAIKEWNIAICSNTDGPRYSPY